MARGPFLTGTDEYINHGIITEMNNLTYWSISGWYKLGSANPGSIVGYTDLISKNVTLQYHKASGKVYGIVQDGSGATCSTVAIANIGWRHLTFVLNGDLAGSARWKCYIDGVFEAWDVFNNNTAYATPNNTLADFAIGRRNYGGEGEGAFNAEVKMWSAALNPAEVMQDYLARPPIGSTADQLREILPQFDKMFFYNRCEGYPIEPNLAGHKWQGVINGSPAVAEHPFPLIYGDEESVGFVAPVVDSFPGWMRKPRIHKSLLTR